MGQSKSTNLGIHLLKASVVGSLVLCCVHFVVPIAPLKLKKPNTNTHEIPTAGKILRTLPNNSSATGATKR